MRSKWMVLALAPVLLCGCSTVMEANRPLPVDLSKYVVGEKRVDVVSALGPPVTTLKDGEHSCDLYKLYVRGPDRAGKAAVILGEAAADFFTVGMSEIVLTPAEAATKSKKHPILFCYASDDVLVSLRDEGKELRAMPVAATGQQPRHAEPVKQAEAAKDAKP